jgi:DNA repair protein RecO (recombination protein O)
MGIEKIEAIVMRSYPLGDTSRIVHLYTAERGRVHVVAKGARTPRNRFGAALEPFSRIGAVIYYRAERDLQFLSQAEILAHRGVLAASMVRFAYGGAVLELLDQAAAGEEPGRELFLLIDSVLDELEQVPEGTLRTAFMSYIARLVSLLGYRPALSSCVGCGREPGRGAVFVALRGGIACLSCGESDPSAVRLSDEARAGLTALVAGKRPAEVPRAVGDEMARVLDGFLRAHLPRYRGLRSLKVMREVSAVG